MKHTVDFFRNAIAEKGRLDKDEAALLGLIPLVQTAWAHGAISPREAQFIFEFAREDGIDSRHWFNEKLDSFLIYQPSAAFFEDCLDLLRASYAAMTVAERSSFSQRLLNRCEKIAASAGGNSLMDLNHHISSEERHLLERLRTIFHKDLQRAFT